MFNQIDWDSCSFTFSFKATYHLQERDTARGKTRHCHSTVWSTRASWDGLHCHRTRCSLPPCPRLHHKCLMSPRLTSISFTLCRCHDTGWEMSWWMKMGFTWAFTCSRSNFVGILYVWERSRLAMISSWKGIILLPQITNRNATVCITHVYVHTLCTCCTSHCSQAF